MMALDLLSYLPDDILVKVDRAAMAVSLETRIPLLDPRVVAYAWSLPDSFRENGSRKKWILRQVLYRYVPPALVDRPKRGFAVPIDLWLRGPLRQWADSLLDPNRVRQEGVLEWVRVDKLWRQFLSGADIGNLIWNILMFQAWQAATPWQTAPDIMKQDIVDATACRSM
jgi:asparagine synthase (glutamine-hydrolysing)